MSRHHTTPFLLLSTHAHVLVAIAEDPDVRQRRLAERIGVTERTVQSVITDLVDNGYVTRTRVGRRNVYEVNPRQTFPHPALQQSMISSMLAGVVAWNDAEPQPAPADCADAALQELAVLAGRLVHAPISLIARREGDAERITGTEILPDGSICQMVAAGRAPVVVADAVNAPADSPLAQLGLRAYAVLPAVTPSGSLAGAVCVADTQPRRWSQGDVNILTSIAVAAAAQIDADDLGRRYQEEARRYRALLDSLPEAVVLVFDRDLRVQVASGEALARSGFDKGHMVGRMLDEIVTPERDAIVRPHYLRGLAGERHRFAHSSPDGTGYQIDVVPLAGADGVVDGVMAIVRERSALRRAA
jgi:PAS domain S-box-containing protein